MVYENIVMSGGGSKTCSMIGALSCLKESHLLDKVNNFIGVSAASILLLLVSINLDLPNIFNTCNQLNTIIQQLSNQNIVDSIIFENGLSKGKNFVDFLNKVVYQEINIKNPTFLELYKITQKKLSIVITNLTSNKLEIFNYENYPNFKVTEAIRMSCGLPFLFSPVLIFELNIKYNNINIRNNFDDLDRIYDIAYISSLNPYFIGYNCNKKKIKISIFKEDFDVGNLIGVIHYLEKKWIFYNLRYSVKINNEQIKQQSCILRIGDILNIGNDIEVKFLQINIYADGAIIDNFPIQLSEKLKGKTLGITMKYEEVKNDEINNEIMFNENILSYLNRIKDCTLNKSHVEKLKKYRDNYITINIPSNLSIYNFNISIDDIKKIIKNGYNKTNLFLQRKNLKGRDNQKLVLFEVDSLDTINSIIKNKKKLHNQFYKMYIGVIITNNKISIIKKYKRNFYYIITQSGNLIIRDKEIISHKCLLKQDPEKYNQLIHKILKSLSNLPSSRMILNSQFIIENYNELVIHPFGCIKKLNSEEISNFKLSSYNKETFLQYYQDIKNLLFSEYSIDYNLKSYSINIKPKNIESFLFLNQLLHNFKEVEVFLQEENFIKLNNSCQIDKFKVKIRKLSMLNII